MGIDKFFSALLLSTMIKILVVSTLMALSFAAPVLILLLILKLDSLHLVTMVGTILTIQMFLLDARNDQMFLLDARNEDLILILPHIIPTMVVSMDARRGRLLLCLPGTMDVATD